MNTNFVFFTVWRLHPHEEICPFSVFVFLFRCSRSHSDSHGSLAVERFDLEPRPVIGWTLKVYPTICTERILSCRGTCSSSCLPTAAWKHYERLLWSCTRWWRLLSFMHCGLSTESRELANFHRPYQPIEETVECGPSKCNPWPSSWSNHRPTTTTMLVYVLSSIVWTICVSNMSSVNVNYRSKPKLCQDIRALLNMHWKSLSNTDWNRCTWTSIDKSHPFDIDTAIRYCNAPILPRSQTTAKWADLLIIFTVSSLSIVRETCSNVFTNSSKIKKWRSLKSI